MPRNYSLFLFLFFILLHISSIESYSFGIGVSGCDCIGSCERTVDSPFRPWCYTSERGLPAPSTSNLINITEIYCGRYSVSRLAYWDECIIINTTGTSNQVVQLQTFEEMWSYMTISIIGSMTFIYSFSSCLTLWYITPGSAIAIFLPLSVGLLGACQGFFIGAMFAAIVAFIYLSIPYAIDARVAISMGIGLSVLLSYTSLGRQYIGGGLRTKRGNNSITGGPPHASEYID